MNKDGKTEEEECIYDIAYSNIILKGFLQRVLETKIEQEKEEKKGEEEKKEMKKKEENEIKIEEGIKDVKKVPSNEMLEIHKTVLSNIFKTNYDKIEVIKKTMKDYSEKLDKAKVLEYLNNNVFPNIFKMLTTEYFLFEKLSPQILNIISNTYNIFIKIIKIEMKEYEISQNIIAESLLEKDTLEKIGNKLKQRKISTKKNNNNKEEASISNVIYEARKLKYFSDSGNESNEELKKYITELEDDLKEKEDFIKGLLFEEYIHQENYQMYLNMIKDKDYQIDKYYSKIHELEINQKKNNNDKNNLNKEIFFLNKKNEQLNNKNEQLNNKVNNLSKEKSRLNEEISKLSNENEELKNKVHELCLIKRELETNCQNLSKENNELNEKLYEGNNEIKNLRNELNLKELKVDFKDGKIHNLENRIKYMEIEAQKLIAQYDEIKKLH